MIDKNIEPYYDIMLNIFLGFFLVVIIYLFYDLPRTVVVYSNSNKKDIIEVKEINSKYADWKIKYLF